jgi:predicted Zn-dependent protease
MMALANLYAGRGEPDRARTLLERVMSEHPGFVGAAGPYALTLLRTGESPEHVVAEIERRVPRLTPSVRAVLASALLAHGALRAAAEQYRLILESRASSTHVRVTLAETLLKLKELGEAAELARAVSDDDPFAALAARIELWAIIAADGLDGLPAAEARAARVGVSAAELDVFARWAAVTRGQVPAGALAVAGAPLLGVILESLLAGHEFLAFERLVPVLVQSGLPRREQRELLAGMYLRHGFLQSAAQEWMAVAQEAPDARALLGLARVAAAHGAHEEARTFAENAAALDPANVAARDLLIGLRPESLAGVA